MGAMTRRKRKPHPGFREVILASGVVPASSKSFCDDWGVPEEMRDELAQAFGLNAAEHAENGRAPKPVTGAE